MSAAHLTTDPLTEALRREREARLIAQLCSRGFTAMRRQDGTYVCHRWGLSTSPMADLDALADFARQVGATQ